MPPSPLALTTIAAATSFGLAGRREPREPRVDVLLGDGAAARRPLQAFGPELGGSRLAGHLDARAGRRRCPVPVVTTPIIRPRSVAAVSAEVTRTGCGGRPQRAVADQRTVGLRTPPLAIAWATDAISSGVASTCALADRGHAEVEVVWRSRRGCVLCGGSMASSARSSKRLGGELKP